MPGHEALELTSIINRAFSLESEVNRVLLAVSFLNVVFRFESIINQSLSLVSLVELEEV